MRKNTITLLTWLIAAVLQLSFSNYYERCLNHLVDDFYSQDVVYEALNIYMIPQAKWSKIYHDLRQKNGKTLAQFNSFLQRHRPSPLEPPMDSRALAMQLKNILYAEFMAVMVKHNMNERPTADLIFERIYLSRADYIIYCFNS